MKKLKETKLSEETINLFKIMGVVAISFGVIYLVFILLGKIGMFEKGYDAPEAVAPEFTYNTAIIGTVFNRSESEYYVAFNEEDANTYFETVLNLYKGDLKIYKVNMSLGINSEYASEKGNNKATKPSELKIASPTLIKIKNGKIVKYFETQESWEAELSK